MTENAPHSLNPNALRPDEAARLLTTAGGEPVSEEMIAGDIDAGAPTNADGTFQETAENDIAPQSPVHAGRRMVPSGDDGPPAVVFFAEHFRPWGCFSPSK